MLFNRVSRCVDKFHVSKRKCDKMYIDVTHRVEQVIHVTRQILMKMPYLIYIIVMMIPQ